MLTNILDRLIAGDSLENVVNGSKSDSAGEETIFDCDMCNYKTKSKSGLKHTQNTDS